MRKLIVAVTLLASIASVGVVAGNDDAGSSPTVEAATGAQSSSDAPSPPARAFSAIDVAAAIASSSMPLRPGGSKGEHESAASALTDSIAVASPSASADTQRPESSTSTAVAPGPSGSIPSPKASAPISTIAPSTSPPAMTPSPSPPPTTAPTPPSPKHYVFGSDTNFTKTFRLRPGDTVELRHGACLCFGPGGNADWRGTPTQTWSDEGRTQHLTRDIKIFGSGHIRFEHGSTKSTITYVEIDLRPPVELAKYPLHWHHVGNGSRGTLVEGVVIKNSRNRAFVAHASHGITFRDTIAKDVAGSAYWWDPPPFQSQDRANNSHDISYEHALADGVVPLDGVSAHRLAAFTLSAGTGNRIVNSTAMNVDGGKDSAGFHWPTAHHSQPQTWQFNNNVAHHNSANGIFVWTNSSDPQTIRGYRGYSNGHADIDHGAYSNVYHYRDVRAESVEVHASGWAVTGGIVERILSKRHRIESVTVTCTNVIVGRFIVDNAANSGKHPGHYVFTNTGLTWDRVTIKSAVKGTTITIDGETRTY